MTPVLTLLELRDASRLADAKTQAAREIISDDYVSVLCAWRHGKLKTNWSIHDFFYALARLDGHQNRKGDHAPGWITIWRGWNDLQAMVAGVEAMKRLNKCGQTQGLASAPPGVFQATLECSNVFSVVTLLRPAKHRYVGGTD